MSATTMDKGAERQPQIEGEHQSHLGVPATRTMTEAETSTLAEEPRPDNVEPLDDEKGLKHQPGASWKGKETHEIPHK